jgi:hypothetical protein
LKKLLVFLSVAFAISLGANIYLFKLVADWQEAWLEQILTTADIERLYRKSGADVSFSAMKELVGKELGEYKIVPVTDSNRMFVKADKSAILVDGTKLYFKDGTYIGSKANLHEGLVHWRLGQDEF